MKRIYKTVFICILLAGMFTACSKNDKQKVVKPDNKTIIVGTWKMTRSEFYFLPDGSTEEEYVNGEAKDQTVIFTPDGKMTDGASSSQNYKITDDNLAVIDDKGGVTNYLIRKLDPHNLVISLKLRQTTLDGRTGIPVQVLIFTK